MHGILDTDLPEIQRLFNCFAESLVTETKLPASIEISTFVQQAMKPFTQNMEPDNRLLSHAEAEFMLFKIIEFKHNCAPIDSICDTLKGKERFDALYKKFLSLQNSRKTRAGLSLENHLGFELALANLQYDTRKLCGPKDAEGKSREGRPDLLFPSVKAYNDPSFPADRLIMVEVKRTNKERWREILKTAPRAEARYLLFTEEGVSKELLTELARHRFGAIIPKPLQAKNPVATGLKVYSITEFIDVAEAYQSLGQRVAVGQ